MGTHIFRSKEQFLVHSTLFRSRRNQSRHFYNVSWPVSSAVLVRYSGTHMTKWTDPLFAVRCTINQPRSRSSLFFFFFLLLFLVDDKAFERAGLCILHQRLIKGLIVDLTALCNVSMPTPKFSSEMEFQSDSIRCPILFCSLISSSGPICPQDERPQTHRQAPVACVVFTDQFFQLLIQLI